MRHALHKPAANCGDIVALSGVNAAEAGKAMPASSAITSCGDLCSQAPVYPRDYCGGFNGNVRWYASYAGTIYIWGELWDLCGYGYTEYLYLSYNTLTHLNHYAGPPASDGATVGINDSFYAASPPSNIAATVCTSAYGNWSCGTPYHV